jgi:hypothetical protein
MKKLTLFALAAVLAMAVACGGSKDDPDKVAQNMISMMEQLGKAAKDNQDDCGKMADAMSKVIESNKATIESAKKLKGNEEESKKLMEKYGDKMMAAAMGMMPAMKCSTDPKMKELEKKMDFMK